MLQGTCLLCFTVNIKTFDILNTHLQQVLEKIVDSKIEAESLCLCFICHKRMQQCHQLMELAKTSLCYLSTVLTEKVDVNLKKQLPLLELTTSKMVNIISFSHFESHIERDRKLKKQYLNVDEIEQQGVNDDLLKYISSEHNYQKNTPTWIKTEFEKVAIECKEMEQQENYDESSECNEGVTDDPLKDNSSEHDDQQNATTWIKTEVEEVAIDYEGLAEIKRDNDEQMTSVHEETSSIDCYRPEFSNILIAPDTENVKENRQNTLNTQSVTGKVYMCKFCHYVTKKKADMERHQRIHSGEKPYSCDICKRKFSQRGNLKRHIKTHIDDCNCDSEIKPFSCDICQCNLLLKSALRKHMLVHTDGKLKIKEKLRVICGDKKFSIYL